MLRQIQRCRDGLMIDKCILKLLYPIFVLFEFANNFQMIYEKNLLKVTFFLQSVSVTRMTTSISSKAFCSITDRQTVVALTSYNNKKKICLLCKKDS